MGKGLIHLMVGGVTLGLFAAFQLPALAAEQRPGASMVETELRPVLAVLPGPVESGYNDALYTMLSRSTYSLGRFRIMDRAKIMQTLMSGSDTVKHGYQHPQELGKFLGADYVLFAELLDEPEVHKVYGEATPKHRATVTASVWFVNVRTEKATLGFEVKGEGSVEASEDEASFKAVVDVARNILGHIRSITQLKATITRRDQRVVTLDRGYRDGLREGFFFSLLDGQGAETGLALIDEVRDDTSTAVIVKGIDAAQPGMSVIENPAGRMPTGVAYALRTVFDHNLKFEETMHTLDYQINHSGLWNALGLEAGWISHQGRVSGLSLLGRIEPQLDLIPSKFWLYSSLGAGIGVFSPDDAGYDKMATAVSFHVLGSLGANLQLFERLSLFGDIGYMTPWTLTNWRKDNQAVTSPMPQPFVGGPFTRLGCTWAF